MRWITAVVIIVLANSTALLMFIGTAADLGAEPAPSETEGALVPDIDSWRIETDYNLSDIEAPEPDIVLDYNVARIGSIGWANLSRQNASIRPYALYRINNSFGTATRYQVHGPDGHVDPATEKTIMSIIAWRQLANNSFTQEEKAVLSHHGFDYRIDEESEFILPIHTGDQLEDALSILSYRQALQEQYQQPYRFQARYVYNVSSTVADHVGPIATITDQVTDLIEDMRSQDLAGGQSVWDAATMVSPTLEATASGIETLDTELQAWNDTSRNLSSSSYALYDLFRTYEYQARLEPDQPVGELLQAYENDLSTFLDKTSELNRTLSTLQFQVSIVAGKASAFEVVGDRAARLFTSLSGRINSTRQIVAGVHRNVSTQQLMIDQINAEREQQHQRYRTRVGQYERQFRTWDDRSMSDSTARMAVYSTLFLLLVMLGSVFVIFIKGMVSLMQIGRWIGERYYESPESVSGGD